MARWALVIFAVCAALSLALAGSDIDLMEAGAAVVRVDAATWALILSLSLVNYVLRFGRWHAYLRHLRNRIPAGRHFVIYLSGFALAPTPAKAGESIRALHLKPFGVGIGRTLSTLYAERLLDVVTVSLLAALLYLAPISEFRWLAVIGGMIAAALLAAQHPRVPALVRRTVSRSKSLRLRNAAQQFATLHRDVTSLVRPHLLAFGLATGLVAWAAEGVGLYLVADALGIEVGFWSAIGIYAAAMLAGALSFIPGGLGSAEATMAALLTFMGAPLPIAIVATLVIRLATLWFAVALGVVAWLSLEASQPRTSESNVAQGPD